MADTYGPTRNRRGLAIDIVVALVIVGGIVAIALASGGGSAAGGYAIVALSADRLRALRGFVKRAAQH